MITSAELRWFWKDDLPADLRRWFESSGAPPAGGEPRVDVYLLDPAQSELSLKHRGALAGVEVKGLIRRRGWPLAVGPFSGQVEVWTKWTSRALRLDGLPTIHVRKARRMRKFDADDVEVREVASGTGREPELGCTLELTEVSLPGREGVWWTLSVEAFGSLDRVQGILARTLAHLVGREAPTFTPGVEQSYARWLAERGTG